MKKVFIIPSLVLLALTTTSCSLNAVKGNGHMASKSFPHTGFKDIDAESSINVILTQGNAYSVKADAEENILALMDIRTEGDKLVIGFKNHVNINTTRDIKVYVTAPEFRKLEGSGACNFTSTGMISGNEVDLDLSGASNARLHLDVKKLDVDASGASEIELKGKSVDFSVDGSGSTSVKAFAFLAENANVGISGAGDAEVFASRSLKVDISGAGSVDYKGNPSSVRKEVSGAGNVNKAD